MRWFAVFVVCIMAMAAAVSAQQPRFDMVRFFHSIAMDMARAPVLLDAIRARNAQDAALTAEALETLERDWRRVRNVPEAPLYAQIILSEAADTLRQQIDASAGHIAEAMIMGATGLTVAAAHPPSDLWQGDEPKFQQSFGAGAEGVHVSRIAFDESSQAFQMQISVAVTDPVSGEVIGAISIGVDASSLM